jgi:hypothetical protein
MNRFKNDKAVSGLFEGTGGPGPDDEDDDGESCGNRHC